MRYSMLILSILLVGLLAPSGYALAGGIGPPVQEINGSLAPGQVDLFRLSGL
jgi:hypothetical protein